MNENVLTLFGVPQEESAPTESIPGPASHLSITFKEKVRDFGFSSSYPLVYALYYNSTVVVHDIVNNVQLKEFTASSNSQEPILRILPFRSFIRHDLKADEIKEDSTLRDLFLTISQGLK